VVVRYLAAWVKGFKRGRKGAAVVGLWRSNSDNARREQKHDNELLLVDCA